MSDCKPPSEIDQQSASGVGDIVEGVIRADYCAFKGGCLFFPLGHQDFTDRRDFGSQEQFIAFLKVANPGVSVNALALAAHEKDLVPVPDLLFHASPRFEFYEIKANSSNGRSEGRRKISKLMPLFGTHGLPYLPGVVYTPNRTIPILVESTGLYEVTVSLKFFRLEPGLVVYELCTDTKINVQLPEKAKRALKAALISAAIAALVELFAPVLVPVFA